MDWLIVREMKPLRLMVTSLLRFPVCHPTIIKEDRTLNHYAERSLHLEKRGGISNNKRYGFSFYFDAVCQVHFEMVCKHTEYQPRHHAGFLVREREKC